PLAPPDQQHRQRQSSHGDRGKSATNDARPRRTVGDVLVRTLECEARRDIPVCDVLKEARAVRRWVWARKLNSWQRAIAHGEAGWTRSRLSCCRHTARASFFACSPLS